MDTGIVIAAITPIIARVIKTSAKVNANFFSFIFNLEF